MNRKFLVVFTFAILFVLPLLASPVVAYTLSSTPQSTTTTFGIPVGFTVTGAKPADTYYVVEVENSVNTTIYAALVADSSGTFTFTITPDDYGTNMYYVGGVAAGAGVEITFAIDNMDIMPYILILITISILFGVLQMFTGGGKSLLG